MGLTDVVPKIIWLRAHDDVAQRIAEAGRALALTQGSPRCVTAFWAAALRVLSKYQNSSHFEGVARGTHKLVPRVSEEAVASSPRPGLTWTGSIGWGKAGPSGWYQHHGALTCFDGSDA